MAASYAEAKAQVGRLVDKFSRLSAHNRKGYNEAATRQEFILPLFHALGWNTEDTREVSPEEQVSRGYVDYAFRLHGIPRFFLETKKIPTDLDDPRWAQQTINCACKRSMPRSRRKKRTAATTWPAKSGSWTRRLMRWCTSCMG